MRFASAAIFVLAISAMPTLVAAKSGLPPVPKIAIYVGPQTRDGFVDIDSGILDSIKDIQDELRGSRQFNVVRTGNEAAVVLIVVGRRTPGSSGSFGVPVGTATMFLPIKRRAIDVILRVGTYEKAITSESDNSGHWKEAAKNVVSDVTAWVSANREAMASR